MVKKKRKQTAVNYQIGEGDCENGVGECMTGSEEEEESESTSEEEEMDHDSSYEPSGDGESGSSDQDPPSPINRPVRNRKPKQIMTYDAKGNPYYSPVPFALRKKK